MRALNCNYLVYVYSTKQNSNMEYQNFIDNKKQTLTESGFHVEQSELNPLLFEFQKYCVQRSLKQGRFALFQDCGLGKTFQQLEWANKIVQRTARDVLILCPLAVAGQTLDQGVQFNIEVQRYNESNIGKGVIHVNNYDQLDNIDASQFVGVVLDESSILKNFEGKTRTAIIEMFRNTPYKLACTATPSPNDPMELGNHAEFLNVMKREEMLAMYFVHDGGATSKWRIKGHAEKNFWRWVSSWAIMLSKPSDIGFSDEGYDLPGLNYTDIKIKTEKRENGKLFNDVSVSATEFNQELRLTLIPRIEAVADIVNNSDENFIVWVRQDAEADKVKIMIPDAVEVRGSHKSELKESRLLGFAKDEFRVLCTKAKIAQFGLNYQNCNNQVFAALDFSFEAVYQAIRRSYRFGQTKKVNIYLVTTDTMENVIKSIRDKQIKFDNMQKHMQDAMNEAFTHQSNFNQTVTTMKTDNYEIIQGDCVEQIKTVADNAADLVVFSPPFAQLYTYTDDHRDMGNSTSYDEFTKHFEYLIPELSRTLKAGRICAIHCMDLPIQKGKEGFIGLRDFSGMIERMFVKHGFIYHARVTIWKNPVTEMQRTKALGLLHKQIKKDATMSRVGIPDYVLFFRNAGENETPVEHQVQSENLPNYLPVDLWQKYASPVWMDVNYGRTLNYRSAKADKDEKHICPLQLDTIERIIHLYSNEGETVLSPFGGIGSEGYQAIMMKRKSISIELKASYFNLNVQNHKAASLEVAQPMLFDLV